MINHKKSRLIQLTLILAFIVILLGGYTRLTDAGLSCPDWPNCYGYLTAPHTEAQIRSATKQFPSTPVNVKKAWTEMTHRYVAGTEGLLILLLTGTILFSKQSITPHIKKNCCILVGLLIVQILLGMLTVTAKLKPVIVLSHLIIGLSILSMIWWIYLSVKASCKPLPMAENLTSQKFLIPSIWFALLLVISQIALGGWMSTHFAGLACVDFPYCNGQLLPMMNWHALNTDLISIHMLHRLGALITGLYVSCLAFYLSKIDYLKSAAVILIIFLLAQLTLGILNIIWLRPIHIALTHQAVAILLLQSIIFILAKACQMTEKTNDSFS